MDPINIPFPKWVYDLAKYAANQLESGLAVLDPRELWTLLPQDVQTAGRVLNHYELLNITAGTPVQTTATSPNPEPSTADTAVLPHFAAIPQPTGLGDAEAAQ